MGPHEGGMIVGLLCGGIIGLGIGGLIGAIILRAAAQWVKKIDIPFGSAFGTVLIAGVINYGIGFVFGLLIGAVAPGNQIAMALLQLVLFPIGFLIQAAVISGRHSVSFGSALLIELVMWLIALAIGVVIGVVVLLVGLALGGFGHMR
jgi:hypothetical protein